MSPPDSFSSVGTLAAGGQTGLPQLPIATLIEQLTEHAADVVASQHRLRLFHQASVQIVAELSLPDLLQRIVDVARETVGARYGGLGVVGSDGYFDQFLHSGLDSAEVTRAGEPPKGRGLLAELVEHPNPLRIDQLADDPRSCGFPVGHPRMSTLLGVPILCRGARYAVLYLAEHAAGRPFDAVDEEVAEALVATAGIAIENALLYEESEHRQEWLRAAANLGYFVVGCKDDPSGVLRRTVSVVQGLLDADTVALLAPDLSGQKLGVVVAEGDRASALVGLQISREQSLAWRSMELGRGSQHDLEQVLRGPEADLRSLVPMGPTLALPLLGDLHARGALLVVRRPGRPPFSSTDLDMAETFAGQAAVAMQLVETRASRQRLAEMEQLDRIARQLHEQVVQRLFEISLDVQAAAQRLGEPARRRRLADTVAAIDATISQIRTTVLPADPERTGARASEVVSSVVDDIRTALDLPIELALEMPPDLAVDEDLQRDLQAVLRESLTNISKYARATRIVVRATAQTGRLALSVADDGVGLQGSTRRSGLDNLGRRAEQRGGQLSITTNQEGGLTLTWAIPL